MPLRRRPLWRMSEIGVCLGSRTGGRTQLGCLWGLVPQDSEQWAFFICWKRMTGFLTAPKYSHSNIVLKIFRTLWTSPNIWVSFINHFLGGLIDGRSSFELYSLTVLLRCSLHTIKFCFKCTVHEFSIFNMQQSPYWNWKKIFGDTCFAKIMFQFVAVFSFYLILTEQFFFIIHHFWRTV